MIWSVEISEADLEDFKWPETKIIIFLNGDQRISENVKAHTTVCLYAEYEATASSHFD